MSLSQVEKVKKLLTSRELMTKTNENSISVPASTMPLQSENLTCPYDKCAKTFEQPVVLTNLSKTPRETYYACPYCFSKLEIALENQENLSSVSVKTSDNADVTSPQKCSHHLGYLATLQNDGSIPDECLTCPKLIQCMVKK